MPSWVNPDLQVQMWPPAIMVQIAFSPQALSSHLVVVVVVFVVVVVAVVAIVVHL